MSGVLDAVGRFFEWLANWLDWFDGAELANNLLADAIFALTVGGAILAYLRWRRWQPARRELLRNLKATSESCFWMWDRAANPLSTGHLVWSSTIANDVADRLRTEIEELREVPDVEKHSKRPLQYWRALVRGLTSLREEITRSVDRAQLTLRDDAQLVALVNDLERWLQHLASFERFLTELERRVDPPDEAKARWQQQVEMTPAAVVHVLSSSLDLWNALGDVPGRTE